MAPKSTSLLQGTLDLIVLQLLLAEPTNGYELAQRIQAISREVLNVNAGSLYPSLYRLEARDLIRATWQESKTGRRVKVYSVTAAGSHNWRDRCALVTHPENRIKSARIAHERPSCTTFTRITPSPGLFKTCSCLVPQGRL